MFYFYILSHTSNSKQTYQTTIIWNSVTFEDKYKIKNITQNIYLPEGQRLSYKKATKIKQHRNCKRNIVYQLISHVSANNQSFAKNIGALIYLTEIYNLNIFQHTQNPWQSSASPSCCRLH